MGANARATETLEPRRLAAISTPVAFWTCLFAVVGGLLALAMVGVRAANERRDGVATVGVDAARLLDDTESLYVALADADAVASSGFLLAGLETRERRSRYDADIQQAGQQLAAISANSELSATDRAAVARISEQLVVYSDLIATARANSRLGHPVGAAYQRDASDVMQHQLLPAAQSLYAGAARQLDEGQRAGTSRDLQVVLIAVTVAVVLLLVLVQVFVSVRTRRLLNIGLAAATALAIGLCVTTIVKLEAQREALVRAQSEGSDPMLVLSTARILALRSLNDENLDLIERGTETTHIADFDAVTASIGDREATSGVLGTASAHAVDDAARARIDSIVGLYAAYLDVHARVRELTDKDEYDLATDVAVGDQAEAAAALDGALADEIERSRSMFERHADTASLRVNQLPLTVLVIVVVAIAFAIGGMWPRLREYR
jgi:hypothetical protein